MYPRLLLSISLLLMAAMVHNGARAELRNSLANNASPYLAMHGGDPVHWQEWNEQSVATARKENKLLFVSIGYFACHWCHVMQRESYQNRAIAVKLNRNFIPVKVDRELNPALDTRLIEFVERTRGYSGWPLNVFITPEGYPLLGIVYLPADDFSSLLSELNTLWQQDRAQLITDAKAASDELQAAPLKKGVTIQNDLAKRVRVVLKNVTLTRADSFAGGFGNQSKFPSVPQLAAMLDSYTFDGDVQIAEFLHLTLDNMARLGLNDIIGGGFYRYTVDPQWRVPHFEKMLYDNALLASLYMQAGMVFDEPRYLETARQTLDFMAAELLSEQGGLYASLSAIDSNNIEGGYYLWQQEELKKILGTEEWLAVSKAWQMEAGPTTEDGYLPVAYRASTEVAAELGITETELARRLAAAKQKMLTARGQRSLPVDNKLLAAWNGLALTAFTRAAVIFNDSRYKRIANGIRNFLLGSLWQKDQLLRARDKHGQAIGEATLEDYAYVAQGLLAWASLTKESTDYDDAGQIIGQAWKRFFTPQGWRLTETSLLANAPGEVMLADGPMPSPSAELLRATLDLLKEKEDTQLREQTTQAISVGQGLLLEDPYWFASHARAVFALQQP
jgi:uncharacterized protein YyaL (SSP411 family)